MRIAHTPVAGDAYIGRRAVLEMVHINVLSGEYDDVVDNLDTVLSVPADAAVADLRLDSR